MSVEIGIGVNTASRMKVSKLLKKVLGDRGKIERLSTELNRYKTWVPPGHFYSPIPDLNQTRNKEDLIWGEVSDTIPGIDLNTEEQLHLLNKFSQYYKEIPFSDNKQPDYRYYFKNKFYSYGDAITLYSMLRYLKPKRIVEAGSGYSSCVILDANEFFFKNSIDCTFIEPFPGTLLSLIKEGDKEAFNLIPYELQDVKEDVFRNLEPNDILFIDSTHVSKINSDVNYIFFEILPTLSKGVYIHYHDIFYPFEYPKEWIYEGRAWNEAYILRAFLQYNNSFRIVFFNTFLLYFYKDILNEKMPLFLKNPGGSIWIKKV